MNETPRRGDARRAAPDDAADPDERGPGGEGTVTGNELGAYAGTTTGLGGTGNTTAGGGFGADLSSGTTPSYGGQVAATPRGDRAEQPADPIRYAWRGWNDPAYHRQILEGTAQGNATPRGPDAPEGASSPAYTTGSGRSVPERVEGNPPPEPAPRPAESAPPTGQAA